MIIAQAFVWLVDELFLGDNKPQEEKFGIAFAQQV